MLAFQDGFVFRPVEIPQEEWDGADSVDKRLNLVYGYGQNGKHVKEEIRTTICSVSVADVIQFPNGKLFMVMPFGFDEITNAEFAEHLATPRIERGLRPYMKM